MDQIVMTEEPKSTSPFVKKVLNIFFALCFIIIGAYYTLSAPVENNKSITIHISKGESMQYISDKLEARHAVRYASVLKIFLRLFTSDKLIQIGDYKIDSGKWVLGIAWQIARHDHQVSPIKVTFPEGSTIEDMAKILAVKLTTFRKDLFLSDPRTREGYLFPDTYFFYPLSTTDEIVNALSSEFNAKIRQLEPGITLSGHSLSDIVIMASLIQKEAKGTDDAGIISGILWKRIKLGMALQVDALPSTYKFSGLPSKAISNPGIVTLEASIYPIESPYLFYLHDDNGMVHYARNFSEHRSNIARYLK